MTTPGREDGREPRGGPSPGHGPAFRLSRRPALALGAASALCLVAFAWPLLADSRGGALTHGNSNLAHGADAPWVFVALLPLLLAIVLAELAEGTLDAKSVALLGVLAACGSALRLPGGVSGFEPVFFLLIPAGRVLGRGFGFVLGALTLFASALITGGVGPWLPFQMFGAAWVGFFAGCLPPARGRRELALLAAYGFVAGLAYGLLLDLWFWPYLSVGTQLGPVPGAPVLENLHRFLAYHLATAMGWDLMRAVTNAVLVLVVGAPVLAALRRAARRAAFGAPMAFDAGHRYAPTASSDDLLISPPGDPHG
jgi:energy-coupling factor transport system substrate-specific component